MMQLRGNLYGASFCIKRNTLPFTWQWRAGTAETANVWNQGPEWNLLNAQLVWNDEQSVCERRDDANANANANASQCILP